MAPDVWLELHAVGYNNLSKEERQVLKDFSLLWSLFEALVLNTRGDASKIVHACSDLKSAGRIKRERFDEALKYFSNRYFDGNALTSKFDGLNLGKSDHQALVEKVLKGGSEDDGEALSAVLIIIYRLRNNLFHGPKWSYGIAGQLLNFQHANTVLMAATEF